jgi:hypothetical protein
MSLEQELKLQQGIRQAEDDLVKWIQKALDESKYEKTGKDKLEESQFRNLVRVADTTESVEVVKNFLRYQVGRGEKWGRGKGSLAEKIIEDIDGNIRQKAKDIGDLRFGNVPLRFLLLLLHKDCLAGMLCLRKCLGGYSDDKRIWIELTRRYLGYGARYLKYKLLDGETQKEAKPATTARQLPQKISR